jgi:FG-GAP repeat.
MFRKLIFCIAILAFVSCSDESNKKIKPGGYTDGVSTLFTKINTDQSKITFKNMVREDLEFNFLNYPYLYAGAGVAVGDIDHDGLQDVYLTSNFGPNKLYKNKGNFEFEDITLSSKLKILKALQQALPCWTSIMMDGLIFM